MDGGSSAAKQTFRELMDDLGFSNLSVFKPLRDLCELKAMEFVRNEGSKFVKNGQVKVNPDGTRVWAMYTADWLKEDWNGNTSDPCISCTRNQRKKPRGQFQSYSLTRSWYERYRFRSMFRRICLSGVPWICNIFSITFFLLRPPRSQISPLKLCWIFSNG